MSRATPTSPRLARRLLERLLPLTEREFVIGDLEEVFAARLAAGVPVRTARRAYWRAALNSIVSLRLWTSRRAQDRGSFKERRREPLRHALGTLKDAWRGLTFHPGYTVLIAATLAIGIGVSTVMFAVADWLVLRPIAGVQDPGRLVTVWASIPRGLRPISEADRVALEARSPSFQGLAGYSTTPIHVLAPAAREATRLQAQLVSGGYFSLLGPRVVVRGRRSFTEAEGRDPGQAAVAVISDRMWRRDFAADPTVLGRSFVVNRQRSRSSASLRAAFTASSVPTMWTCGCRWRRIASYCRSDRATSFRTAAQRSTTPSSAGFDLEHRRARPRTNWRSFGSA